MANIPTLDEWRALYAAAAQIKAAAPWEWLEETDIFGVQNPDKDEIGFISIMGMAGEHFSIAVYLGARGLYGFAAMQEAALEGDFEPFLLTPHMQASFEDREALEDQDRAVIKKLGLKFRGKSEWPLFRSHQPAHVPWYLEADEARFLTVALQQVLDVALRVKENPDLLNVTHEDLYLVRVPKKQADGSLIWEDRTIKIQEPKPVDLNIPMDITALDQLKSLPLKRAVVEVDFFLLPSGLQDDREERPYFPYMLLMVESENGTILGAEMVKPKPTIESAWEQVPLTLTRALGQAKLRPTEIRTYLPEMVAVLEPMAKQLGFKLVESEDELSSLEDAKEGLLGYMLGGMGE
jgi:hypothetical protein